MTMLRTAPSSRLSMKPVITTSDAWARVRRGSAAGAGLATLACRVTTSDAPFGVNRSKVETDLLWGEKQTLGVAPLRVNGWSAGRYLLWGEKQNRSGEPLGRLVSVPTPSPREQALRWSASPKGSPLGKEPWSPRAALYSASGLADAGFHASVGFFFETVVEGRQLDGPAHPMRQGSRQQAIRQPWVLRQQR